MKIPRSAFLFTLTAQLALAAVCNAQSSKTGTLTAPPAGIRIDGDSKEWGDSLRYYNPEKHINYAVANTRDTLYMAIRVKDRSEQARILRAGVTFTVDPKGKKKDTYSITFPLNINGNIAMADIKKEDVAPGEVSDQDREALMQQRITNLRGIKAVGFKDIEDEMITTSNTYGFQTAVNYDKDGYLVCEAAIPLSYFHADAKNEWAFNFKINGIQRKAPTEGGDQQGQDGMGGGHGGRGGGGGMGDGGGRGGHGNRSGGGRMEGSGLGQSELSKSEDFWEKYYLAK